MLSYGDPSHIGKCPANYYKLFLGDDHCRFVVRTKLIGRKSSERKSFQVVIGRNEHSVTRAVYRHQSWNPPLSHDPFE